MHYSYRNSKETINIADIAVLKWKMGEYFTLIVLANAHSLHTSLHFIGC